MNKRIKELRKALKLSQKGFAAKIGLKQNTVSYLETPGSKITEKNIKIICSQFSVNEHWLRTGEGEMFLENRKKQQDLLEIFNKLCPPLQDYLIKVANELLIAQNEMQSQEQTNN